MVSVRQIQVTENIGKHQCQGTFSTITMSRSQPEPIGGLSMPCMGCGMYYMEPGRHIYARSADGILNCYPCNARGFKGSKDNRDLIKKMNELGVVFEYQMFSHIPRALHTNFSKPRKLTEEEISTLIEIENPLYDDALAEMHPSLFKDKFPQNSKKLRILAACKEKAESMEKETIHHASPPVLKPLNFVEVQGSPDPKDDEKTKFMFHEDGKRDGLVEPGRALMKDLVPCNPASDRIEQGSKMVAKFNIPTTDGVVHVEESSFTKNQSRKRKLP